MEEEGRGEKGKKKEEGGIYSRSLPPLFAREASRNHERALHAGSSTITKVKQRKGGKERGKGGKGKEGGTVGYRC